MAQIKADEITQLLREQIANYDSKVQVDEVGTITSLGDGIARLHGLDKVMAGELLSFPHGIAGLALSLEEDQVGAVILGDYTELKEGQEVKRTGKILSVPVGTAMIGRVVNALGAAHRRQGPHRHHGNAARRAPGPRHHRPPACARAHGHRPQGHRRHDPHRPRPARADHRRPPDRQNRRPARHHHQQRQERPDLHLLRHRPEALVDCAGGADADRAGAMGHTIIVAASASEPAPMLYLAPYAATAMGEYFRDNGKHALVMYDDLSKHAMAYREISLLLRRPPGREAYPGDVFYLHSRLLERSSKMSNERGGGSLTALPVIETQAGDVSAYIPTNVISITDGQIFLETDLFNSGVRPAVNVGLSVSRVGFSAAIKAVKQVGSTLKLDLAQYRELAAFAQFGSDLDPLTQKQLARGERLTELLKQPQFHPLTWQQQMVVLFAGTQGYLDDLQVADIRAFEDGLLQVLRRRAAGADRRPDRRRSRSTTTSATACTRRSRSTRQTSRRSWPPQRRKKQLSVLSSQFSANGRETTHWK